MPGCCEIGDLDDIFGPARADADARSYLRRGLSARTRAIADAILAHGVSGRSVLEIGGGVGALQIELVRAGARSATNVELSRGYEEAARGLIAASGLQGDRIERRVADFVTDADVIEPADHVVLDRVVCCYPDATALVTAAARHARELLVLVLPVERWWTRAAGRVINVWPWLRRSRFRFFVHPTRTVRLSAEGTGMRLDERHAGLVWQTLVFVR